MATYHDALLDLDRRLVRVARDIKVLSALAWPSALADRFLEGWRAGRPALPTPTYRVPDLSEAAAELDAIASGAPEEHPAGAFIARTARSYRATIALLAEVGRPGFLEISTHLYGLPVDTIGDSGPTNLEAARRFIAVTGEFLPLCEEDEADYCVMPETVRQAVLKAAADAFPGRKLDAVIDPELTAKAAAGIDRIRIRGGTCFAEVDISQLIEHELMIHTLTSINGAEQPHIKSLSLGAPRTTATQEGLAVFAELVTGVMDLHRLRRIALRVEGIQRAIEGADFVEVFAFFLESGHSEREAFQSAARVFRGGDPRGRIPFTKDAVYLHGLLAVHTFMRKAISRGQLSYTTRLFAGRLSLADVIALTPCFDDGLIAAPRFTPPWATRQSNLTAFLAFSNFMDRIQLASVDIDSLLADPPERPARKRPSNDEVLHDAPLA